MCHATLSKRLSCVSGCRAEAGGEPFAGGRGTGDPPTGASSYPPGIEHPAAGTAETAAMLRVPSLSRLRVISGQVSEALFRAVTSGRLSIGEVESVLLRAVDPDPGSKLAGQTPTQSLEGGLNATDRSEGPPDPEGQPSIDILPPRTFLDIVAASPPPLLSYLGHSTPRGGPEGAPPSQGEDRLSLALAAWCALDFFRLCHRFHTKGEPSGIQHHLRKTLNHEGCAMRFP